MFDDPSRRRPGGWSVGVRDSWARERRGAAASRMRKAKRRPPGGHGRRHQRRPGHDFGRPV